VADSAGADVELLDDGSAIVRAGAAEIGQGVIGVAAQIVAEELGVPYGRIRVILGDTAETLDGGATTASRQTFITGNAVRLAARQVQAALARTVAEELDVPPDSLVFQDGRIFPPAAPSVAVDLRRAIAWAREEGRQLRATHVYTAPRTAPLGQPGDAHFAFGYGTQAAEVEVDTATGQVRVLRVIAAHDVGRAINPLALRGQLEGGVMMGLGYALLEQVESEEGRIKNATLARYKLPRISQTPEVVPILVEDRAAEGPYGAKGVGEITSIPTAPAILNAIYNATGVRLYDLPATPDRIKQALAKGIGKSGTRESGSGESGNREISDRGRPDSLIS
jgi:xanthine dehydrogenase molybdenum-binding subunit